MTTTNNFPQPAILSNFPLSFRFSVTFFVGGIIPNLLDIYFRKVSGISSEIKTESINEGGQNLYARRLPTTVDYGNLILERGMVVGSPLNTEFNLAMSGLKIKPGNVLITLFNENAIPVSGWVFLNAYPVKWTVSDLDADEDTIVVDTMELAYDSYKSIRI